MMQDWVEVVKESDESVQLRLLDDAWLDSTVFEKMEVDESCIRCHFIEQSRLYLSYSIGEYISLEEVFGQVQFEKRNGYLFLMNLIDSVMACGKNKPVLLAPRFVFVDPYGQDFKMIVVPICVEKWMQQKEMQRSFVEWIGNHFLTQSAYEIPGFIMRFIHSDEFSLMNLYLGLQALFQLRYPKKRFSFRKPKPFSFEAPLKKMHKEEFRIQEEEVILDEQRTYLLGDGFQGHAQLDLNGEIYPLLNEVTLVGRSMACDIRFQLPEVSAKHAKITCQENRYYIQDLRSRNGTFLNDKKVIRKMRLHDGMRVSFGPANCLFRES